MHRLNSLVSIQKIKFLLIVLLQLRYEDPKVPYKKIICSFKETIKDVFDTGLGTFCDKLGKEDQML